MPKKPERSKPAPSEISLLLDKVRRRIEEDEAAAHSQFMQKALPALPDRVAYEQALLKYLVERFNIHAYWHWFLVRNYEHVPDLYEPYLTGLIEEVVKWASKKTSQSSDAHAEQFRHTLRAHLAERKSHWKSEAMKRARHFETEGSATVPPEPPELTDTPPEGAVADTTDEERERRAQLLSQYKAATGNPSNKRIYEAKNSGIHKPDFYAWLKADLSSESAMSINFERFLRLKKVPIPRKPRD